MTNMTNAENIFLNFLGLDDYQDAIEGLQEQLQKAKKKIIAQQEIITGFAKENEAATLENATLKKRLAVLEKEYERLKNRNAALELNLLLRN